MRKKERLEIFKTCNVEKLINDNYSIYYIQKKVKEHSGYKPQPDVVRTFARQFLRKQWDTQKKKWIPISDENSSNISKAVSEDDDSPNNNLESSLENSTNNVNFEEFPSGNTNIIANDNPTNSILEEIRNELNIFNDNQKTLLDKTYELESDMKKIKKIFKEMCEEKSNEDCSVSAEDLIKIYGSEKNKKSVNINAEIKERIEKLIGENYGVKDNDSLIINLALLRALYMK